MSETTNTVNQDVVAFFQSNSFFIDEKVNIFKFENAYNIYGETGEHIGAITQRLSIGEKMLRLLVNKKMLPYTLVVQSLNGNVLTTIQRGWTLFMSKIDVKDASGVTIGYVKQKFKFFKPEFQILNASEQVIATITGDWKAWNFDINNATKNPIGKISKKWAGAMKEIFTTADKYNVVLDPAFELTIEYKQIIVSCAITIDMVLKESK
ncbi:phospholipid scramblase-related protein [uncultured Cytophaga sp.]|uniref:LURP-one-related/scramblase family protein n=1 Tax=uncultured Cytophaga sp. TaxID=160238 RepID=UPI00260F9FC8|nr:phospholipid scramblase-related protein [uncultured Cytophaga sp.]